MAEEYMRSHSYTQLPLPIISSYYYFRLVIYFSYSMCVSVSLYTYVYVRKRERKGICQWYYAVLPKSYISYLYQSTSDLSPSSSDFDLTLNTPIHQFISTHIQHHIRQTFSAGFYHSESVLKSFIRVQLFMTPWTTQHQTLLYPVRNIH